ncbi:hypothetical protein PG993_015180 [Apiospora rasikravindrae]|uniref:Protein kinase domain-containing protein n=1 Tax=Apiospora rasikravindrae TaxID=990691 RepID=A0ABR1RPV2_9PEZI
MADEDGKKEQIARVRTRLRGFLEHGNKFKFEKLIGSGIEAHAWLVQRQGPNDGDPGTKYVLKTPSFIEGPDSAAQFQNPAGMTVFGGERRLLNRLTERYAVIRACVAMAYVPAGPPMDRYSQNEEPCDLTPESFSYTHNDMYSANIMIGAMLGDPDDLEHLICPVFKFIDLDNHTKYPGGEGTGVQRNLFNVGANMAEVVLRYPDLSLDIGENRDDEEEAMEYDIEDGGTAFVTCAHQLLPSDETDDELPRQELDPDLRRLICRCAAFDPNDRPRLADELLPTVKKAIEERDAAYYARMSYCDETQETDEAILRFLEEVLGAAPPPPLPPPAAFGAGAEGEEEGGEGPESFTSRPRGPRDPRELSLTQQHHIRRLHSSPAYPDPTTPQLDLHPVMSRITKVPLDPCPMGPDDDEVDRQLKTALRDLVNGDAEATTVAEAIDSLIVHDCQRGYKAHCASPPEQQTQTRRRRH